MAGAGGGLGQATTATLAAGGLTVVAVERNEQASRELPVGVRREVADTTDPAAAKGLIDRVDGEVGPGRAGEHHRHVPPRRRAQYDPGDAAADDRHQPGTRALAEPGGGGRLTCSGRARGAIVHVVARPGIEPSGSIAAYGVSKAALVDLTHVLDIGLRPHGIRVNAVAPQLLDTPANWAIFPGRGASARGRAGGDRRRDRIPGQRRRRAGERSDPAGLPRIKRLTWRDVRPRSGIPLATGLPWCALTGTRSSAIQGGGKSRRNQHVHACPWSIGSAVLWSRESP